MFVIPVIFIALGLLLFYLTARGLAASNKGALLCAGYFSIFGLSMLVCNMMHAEKSFVYIFSIGMGIIFIATGVFNISKVFLCTKKTNGTFLGAASQGRGWYVVIFSYQVGKKKYTAQSSSICRARTIRRRYQEGQEYSIWYYPKNPMIFVEKHRIKLLNLWCILLGSAIGYLPFYYLH